MVRASSQAANQLFAIAMLVGLVAGDTTTSDGFLSGAADIVFMFDRSESDVLKSRLEDCMKSAAIGTVKMLGPRVNPDDVRVAAISYSGVSTPAVDETPARLHFNFNQGEASDYSLMERIKKMDLSTNLDWTDASPGYKTARQELFEKQDVSGFRGFDVPVVVILFTDGEVSWFAGSLCWFAGSL
jgi:hypothetical protein